MKILGYCLKPIALLAPVEHWLPAVPIGLLTDNGFLWRDEEAAEKHQFKQINLATPLDLQDDSWVGIESNNSVTVLAKGEEPEWRVSRATQILQSMQGTMTNPIHSIHALHSAAALVGIRVSGLHAALIQTRKSSD